MAGNNQYVTGTREVHELLDEANQALHQVADIVQDLRRHGYAQIISVNKNQTICRVMILDTRLEADAIMAPSTAQWNITGYPATGDLVWISWARERTDVHVHYVVHAKNKALSEYDAFKNNDKITMGLFTP